MRDKSVYETTVYASKPKYLRPKHPVSEKRASGTRSANRKRSLYVRLPKRLDRTKRFAAYRQKRQTAYCRRYDTLFSKRCPRLIIPPFKTRPDAGKMPPLRKDKCSLCAQYAVAKTAVKEVLHKRRTPFCPPSKRVVGLICGYSTKEIGLFFAENRQRSEPIPNRKTCPSETVFFVKHNAGTPPLASPVDDSNITLEEELRGKTQIA